MKVVTVIQDQINIAYRNYIEYKSYILESIDSLEYAFTVVKLITREGIRMTYVILLFFDLA